MCDYERKVFNIGSVSLILQKEAVQETERATSRVLRLMDSCLFYESMLKYASRDLKAFEVMKKNQIRKWLTSRVCSTSRYAREMKRNLKKIFKINK